MVSYNKGGEYRKWFGKREDVMDSKTLSSEKFDYAESIQRNKGKE